MTVVKDYNTGLCNWPMTFCTNFFRRPLFDTVTPEDVARSLGMKTSLYAYRMFSMLPSAYVKHEAFLFSLPIGFAAGLVAGIFHEMILRKNSEESGYTNSFDEWEIWGKDWAAYRWPAKVIWGGVELGCGTANVWYSFLMQPKIMAYANGGLAGFMGGYHASRLGCDKAIQIASRIYARALDCLQFGDATHVLLIQDDHSNPEMPPLPPEDES